MQAMNNKATVNESWISGHDIAKCHITESEKVNSYLVLISYYSLWFWEVIDALICTHNAPASWQQWLANISL